MKQRILISLVVFVYLLHQDFWFWRTPYPLVLGFLPVGLFYHACYTLACAALLALLVKLAWPFQLEASSESLRSLEDEVR